MEFLLVGILLVIVVLMAMTIANNKYIKELESYVEMLEEKLSVNSLDQKA